MGQKVNPVGLRLGINRGWDSVWYAKKKDFGNYLIEDFKIREYVKKNVVNSGVSKVMIERTSKKCFVTIYTSRPGFVIGKKGSDIEKIKGKLSSLTTNEVILNIKEVKKPETNSYLVAENIAQQLVKRVSYRRAMKRAMQSALRLGAKGIKVAISGRLGGNEIARTEWLRDGSIPSHTLRADIDYAESEALTTYGIIGVKVWICKGEVYGKRIEEAKLMPGAADFFLACKERRVRVVIVSHKTKFGHFDPDRVNLRDAAVAWMRAQNFFDKKLLGVSVRNVFFEGTRAGKLGRIKALGCSHFIDDLEEVLLEPGFPNNVVRILFDPDGRAANDRGFERHSDWKSIEHAIFAT